MLSARIGSLLERKFSTHEGTSVVIFDRHQVPIVIVHETADGGTRVHRITDDDFAAQVQALGVDRTIELRQLCLDEDPPPPGAIRL